jgi:hypothetical protein
VKRFFVSEARRAELENLTEDRQSGTPGDFSGASFWYFLREKVLRVFWGVKKLDSRLHGNDNNKKYSGQAGMTEWREKKTHYGKHKKKGIGNAPFIF